MIELGLRLTIHLDLLTCPDPSQSVFLVHSDNLGVVTVTNKGQPRSKETNVTLKHVFLLQAQCWIQLCAIHVPGRDNILDALSRGDIPGFLHGFPSALTRVTMPLPAHLANKLASG